MVALLSPGSSGGLAFTINLAYGPFEIGSMVASKLGELDSALRYSILPSPLYTSVARLGMFCTRGTRGKVTPVGGCASTYGRTLPANVSTCSGLLASVL